jgi:hypothetical protein
VNWFQRIVEWLFRWYDGRGSIVSFGSNNPSSKTSVSGMRKLVPLSWQCENSHCSINKAVSGKTGDSRIKSPHILLTYPHLTFSYSPKSNPRWKGEDLKTWRTLTRLSPVVTICTTLFDTSKLCILPTQCIWVSRMVLTINSDCFPKQHKRLGFVAVT